MSNFKSAVVIINPILSAPELYEAGDTYPYDAKYSYDHINKLSSQALCAYAELADDQACKNDSNESLIVAGTQKPDYSDHVYAAQNYPDALNYFSGLPPFTISIIYPQEQIEKIAAFNYGVKITTPDGIKECYPVLLNKSHLSNKYAHDILNRQYQTIYMQSERSGYVPIDNVAEDNEFEIFLVEANALKSAIEGCYPTENPEEYDVTTKGLDSSILLALKRFEFQDGSYYWIFSRNFKIDAQDFIFDSMPDDCFAIRALKPKAASREIFNIKVTVKNPTPSVVMVPGLQVACVNITQNPNPVFEELEWKNLADIYDNQGDATFTLRSTRGYIHYDEESNEDSDCDNICHKTSKHCYCNDPCSQNGSENKEECGCYIHPHAVIEDDEICFYVRVLDDSHNQPLFKFSNYINFRPRDPSDTRSLPVVTATNITLDNPSEIEITLDVDYELYIDQVEVNGQLFPKSRVKWTDLDENAIKALVSVQYTGGSSAVNTAPINSVGLFSTIVYLSEPIRLLTDDLSICLQMEGPASLLDFYPKLESDHPEMDSADYQKEIISLLNAQNIEYKYVGGKIRAVVNIRDTDDPIGPIAGATPGTAQAEASYPHGFVLKDDFSFCSGDKFHVHIRIQNPDATYLLPGLEIACYNESKYPNADISDLHWVDFNVFENPNFGEATVCLYSCNHSDVVCFGDKITILVRVVGDISHRPKFRIIDDYLARENSDEQNSVYNNPKSVYVTIANINEKHIKADIDLQTVFQLFINRIEVFGQLYPYTEDDWDINPGAGAEGLRSYVTVDGKVNIDKLDRYGKFENKITFTPAKLLTQPLGVDLRIKTATTHTEKAFYPRLKCGTKPDRIAEDTPSDHLTEIIPLIYACLTRVDGDIVATFKMQGHDRPIGPLMFGAATKAQKKDAYPNAFALIEEWNPPPDPELPRHPSSGKCFKVHVSVQNQTSEEMMPGLKITCVNRTKNASPVLEELEWIPLERSGNRGVAVCTLQAPDGELHAVEEDDDLRFYICVLGDTSNVVDFTVTNNYDANEATIDPNQAIKVSIKNIEDQYAQTDLTLNEDFYLYVDKIEVCGQLFPESEEDWTPQDIDPRAIESWASVICPEFSTIPDKKPLCHNGIFSNEVPLSPHQLLDSSLKIHLEMHRTGELSQLEFYPMLKVGNKPARIEKDVDHLTEEIPVPYGHIFRDEDGYVVASFKMRKGDHDIGPINGADSTSSQNDDYYPHAFALVSNPEFVSTTNFKIYVTVKNPSLAEMMPRLEVAYSKNQSPDFGVLYWEELKECKNYGKATLTIEPQDQNPSVSEGEKIYFFIRAFEDDDEGNKKSFRIIHHGDIYIYDVHSSVEITSTNIVKNHIEIELVLEENFRPYVDQIQVSGQLFPPSEKAWLPLSSADTIKAWLSADYTGGSTRPLLVPLTSEGIFTGIINLPSETALNNNLRIRLAIKYGNQPGFLEFYPRLGCGPREERIRKDKNHFSEEISILSVSNKIQRVGGKIVAIISMKDGEILGPICGSHRDTAQADENYPNAFALIHELPLSSRESFNVYVTVQNPSPTEMMPGLEVACVNKSQNSNPDFVRINWSRLKISENHGTAHLSIETPEGQNHAITSGEEICFYVRILGDDDSRHYLHFRVDHHLHSKPHSISVSNSDVEQNYVRSKITLEKDFKLLIDKINVIGKLLPNTETVWESPPYIKAIVKLESTEGFCKEVKDQLRQDGSFISAIHLHHALNRDLKVHISMQHADGHTFLEFYPKLKVGTRKERIRKDHDHFSEVIPVMYSRFDRVEGEIVATIDTDGSFGPIQWSHPGSSQSERDYPNGFALVHELSSCGTFDVRERPFEINVTIKNPNSSRMVPGLEVTCYNYTQTPNPSSYSWKKLSRFDNCGTANIKLASVNENDEICFVIGSLGEAGLSYRITKHFKSQIRDVHNSIKLTEANINENHSEVELTLDQIFELRINQVEVYGQLFPPSEKTWLNQEVYSTIDPFVAVEFDGQTVESVSTDWLDHGMFLRKVGLGDGQFLDNNFKVLIAFKQKNTSLDPIFLEFYPRLKHGSQESRIEKDPDHLIERISLIDANFDLSRGPEGEVVASLYMRDGDHAIGPIPSAIHHSSQTDPHYPNAFVLINDPPKTAGSTFSIQVTVQNPSPNEMVPGLKIACANITKNPDLISAWEFLKVSENYGTVTLNIPQAVENNEICFYIRTNEDQNLHHYHHFVVSNHIRNKLHSIRISNTDIEQNLAHANIILETDFRLFVNKINVRGKLWKFSESPWAETELDDHHIRASISIISKEGESDPYYEELNCIDGIFEKSIPLQPPRLLDHNLKVRIAMQHGTSTNFLEFYPKLKNGSREERINRDLDHYSEEIPVLNGEIIDDEQVIFKIDTTKSLGPVRWACPESSQADRDYPNGFALIHSLPSISKNPFEVNITVKNPSSTELIPGLEVTSFNRSQTPDPDLKELTWRSLERTSNQGIAKVTINGTVTENDEIYLMVRVLDDVNRQEHFKITHYYPAILHDEYHSVHVSLENADSSQIDVELTLEKNFELCIDRVRVIGQIFPSDCGEWASTGDNNNVVKVLMSVDHHDRHSGGSSHVIEESLDIHGHFHGTIDLEHPHQLNSHLKLCIKIKQDDEFLEFYPRLTNDCSGQSKDSDKLVEIIPVLVGKLRHIDGAIVSIIDLKKLGPIPGADPISAQADANYPNNFALKNELAFNSGKTFSIHVIVKNHSTEKLLAGLEVACANITKNPTPVYADLHWSLLQVSQNHGSATTIIEVPEDHAVTKGDVVRLYVRVFDDTEESHQKLFTITDYYNSAVSANPYSIVITNTNIAVDYPVQVELTLDENFLFFVDKVHVLGSFLPYTETAWTFNPGAGSNALKAWLSIEYTGGSTSPITESLEANGEFDILVILPGPKSLNSDLKTNIAAQQRISFIEFYPRLKHGSRNERKSKDSDLCYEKIPVSYASFTRDIDGAIVATLDTRGEIGRISGSVPGTSQADEHYPNGFVLANELVFSTNDPFNVRVTIHNPTPTVLMPGLEIACVDKTRIPNPNFASLNWVTIEKLEDHGTASLILESNGQVVANDEVYFFVRLLGDNGEDHQKRFKITQCFPAKTHDTYHSIDLSNQNIEDDLVEVEITLQHNFQPYIDKIEVLGKLLPYTETEWPTPGLDPYSVEAWVSVEYTGGSTSPVAVSLEPNGEFSNIVRLSPPRLLNSDLKVIVKMQQGRGPAFLKFYSMLVDGTREERMEKDLDQYSERIPVSSGDIRRVGGDIVITIDTESDIGPIPGALPNSSQSDAHYPHGFALVNDLIFNSGERFNVQVTIKNPSPSNLVQGLEVACFNRTQNPSQDFSELHWHQLTRSGNSGTTTLTLHAPHGQDHALTAGEEVYFYIRELENTSNQKYFRITNCYNSRIHNINHSVDATATDISVENKIQVELTLLENFRIYVDKIEVNGQLFPYTEENWVALDTNSIKALVSVKYDGGSTAAVVDPLNVRGEFSATITLDPPRPLDNKLKVRLEIQKGEGPALLKFYPRLSDANHSTRDERMAKDANHSSEEIPVLLGYITRNIDGDIVATLDTNDDLGIVSGSPVGSSQADKHYPHGFALVNEFIFASGKDIDVYITVQNPSDTEFVNGLEAACVNKTANQNPDYATLNWIPLIKSGNRGMATATLHGPRHAVLSGDEVYFYVRISGDTNISRQKRFKITNHYQSRIHDIRHSIDVTKMNVEDDLIQVELTLSHNFYPYVDCVEVRGQLFPYTETNWPPPGIDPNSVKAWVSIEYEGGTTPPVKSLLEPNGEFVNFVYLPQPKLNSDLKVCIKMQRNEEQSFLEFYPRLNAADPATRDARIAQDSDHLVEEIPSSAGSIKRVNETIISVIDTNGFLGPITGATLGSSQSDINYPNGFVLIHELPLYSGEMFNIHITVKNPSTTEMTDGLQVACFNKTQQEGSIWVPLEESGNYGTAIVPLYAPVGKTHAVTEDDEICFYIRIAGEAHHHQHFRITNSYNAHIHDIHRSVDVTDANIEDGIIQVELTLKTDFHINIGRGKAYEQFAKQISPPANRESDALLTKETSSLTVPLKHKINEEQKLGTNKHSCVNRRSHRP